MPDGCTHYEHRLEIWAPCCNQYYRCFRCHDEGDSSSCGKPLDRSNLTKVRCADCGMEQQPARECEGCHISFAEYVCLECSMFRQSHPDGIYHCPDCKVCRIGKGLGISHWHCHSCCLCLCIETVKKEEHQKVCKIDARTSECVICFEPLHDSRDPLVVGHSCGHYLHQSCWEAYNNTSGKIACPICQQPFVEIDEWKLGRAVIVHYAIYWVSPFVAIVMMVEDSLQMVLVTASVGLAVVGVRRHGFVQAVAPIAIRTLAMFTFAPKQVFTMGLASTGMLFLLPIVMDQLIQLLNLPGRMPWWMVLFFEMIATSAAFHYLLMIQGHYGLLDDP